MKIVQGYDAALKALSRKSADKETGRRDIEQAVKEILENVRQRGDQAIIDYTARFDGVQITRLEVTPEEIENGYHSIDESLRAALETAAERIAAFHQQQKDRLLQESREGPLGWILQPIEKIGVYAPGGLAPLPSSLLMAAVPARVAGVKEIIAVTPPQKDGHIAPVTLAAARIAGVTRMFAVGGAQAVAALAYGTESIPAVDKIYGPGNNYVTMAKKLVYGTVGIDGLYGPSEVLIIADNTANPVYCAADMLGQAEHGSGASAILITTSPEFARQVDEEIDRQMQTLQRKDILQQAVDNSGLIAVVESIDLAVEAANIYAPEHLCLVFHGAENYIDTVKNAGCIFVGEHAIEVLVDYVAGPSHVLPTEGTARFNATLNITDFVKIMTLVKTGEKEIRELGKAAAIIARAEGLDAHARSVERRLEDMGENQP